MPIMRGASHDYAHHPLVRRDAVPFRDAHCVDEEIVLDKHDPLWVSSGARGVDDERVVFERWERVCRKPGRMLPDLRLKMRNPGVYRVPDLDDGLKSRK